MMPEDIDKLIDAHFEYSLQLFEFAYKKAFKHGYKHGQADGRKEKQ
jgi:hypothetical protein